MKKLGEVLVQAGVQVYREIIAVLFLSLLSSLVLIPILLFFPVGVGGVLLLLLYFPLFSGVLAATGRLLQGEKGWMKWIGKAIWEHYLNSLVFGLFLTVFILIAVSSWWYYGKQDGLFHLGIAIFQTYFVGMLMVSQLFTLPLMVREGISLFAAMGKSIRLFLNYPLYTIGASIQGLFITLFLGITVMGFLSLYLGTIAIFLNLVVANLSPSTILFEKARTG